MIKHEYTGCALCHADPSGAFLLTAYGRAQQQTLLSSFGRGPEGNEVDHRSEFLMGAVSLPDWILAGGSVREMALSVKPEGAPRTNRLILMQADAKAAITTGRAIFAGSLGYNHEGGQGAAVTRSPKDNLVAREFWAGYRLGEEQQTLVRVGRISLPFGIRTHEHNFYVRTNTGTNIDDQQQWGAALAWGADTYRGEVMAIAGNYQLSPDTYRRRGYAGFNEWVVAPKLGLGVSSMVTYVGTDPDLKTTWSVSGAHGPFLRWVPLADLTVLAEADLLHRSPGYGQITAGGAGMLQLDYEILRGLHGATTTELYKPAESASSNNFRQWVTATWFAYPHLDLRGDAVWASEIYGNQRMTSSMFLAQVHVSL
jgi:hypothetical protein